MDASMVARQLADAGVPDAEREAQQICAAAAEPSTRAAYVQRRIEGEPLGLILGRVMFLGVELHVIPGTLTPRAETELLAATALRELRASDGPARCAIDLCCGVGNVGVVLAIDQPTLHVWATDIAEPCVRAARTNVELHRLSDRLKVMQGDLFEPLRGEGLEGRVDLIACNPPYISTGRLAGDRAGLLKHEPREAFDAGPYGIRIHQRVIQESGPFLREGGCLMFEFGVGQARQLELLFHRSGCFTATEIVRDATGQERVIAARKARRTS